MNNFDTNFCIKKYRSGIVVEDIEIVTIPQSGNRSTLSISKNTFLPTKTK